jgi:hypothetical protein
MDFNQTAGDVKKKIQSVKNVEDVTRKLPWIYFMVAAGVLLIFMIPALQVALTVAIILAVLAGIGLVIAEYGYQKVFQVRWYHLLLPGIGLGLIYYNPWYTVVVVLLIVGVGLYARYQQTKVPPKV